MIKGLCHTLQCAGDGLSDRRSHDRSNSIHNRSRRFPNHRHETVLDIGGQDRRQLLVAFPSNGKRFGENSADITRFNNMVVQSIPEFVELGLFGSQ